MMDAGDRLAKQLELENAVNNEWVDKDERIGGISSLRGDAFDKPWLIPAGPEHLFERDQDSGELYRTRKTVGEHEDELSERDYDSGEYCWDCGMYLEEPRLVEMATGTSPPTSELQPLCTKCWPSCHECPEPAVAKDLDLCPKHFAEQEKQEPLRMNQHTRDWVLAIFLLILVLGLLNLYGPGEILIPLGE